MSRGCKSLPTTRRRRVYRPFTRQPPVRRYAEELVNPAVRRAKLRIIGRFSPAPMWTILFSWEHDACCKIEHTSTGRDRDFRNRDYLKPFEMRTRMSLVRFFGCLLLVAFVGTTNIYAEPEPMARPTRPKAIASPEELERYFDLVRDYYSLRRARYGKRGDDAPPRMSELNITWETLKTILDTQRQNQQRRLGKLKPSKEQEIVYRDYHGLDADRHASHVATRPLYLLDSVGRYYDDVQ